MTKTKASLPLVNSLRDAKGVAGQCEVIPLELGSAVVIQ